MACIGRGFGEGYRAFHFCHVDERGLLHMFRQRQFVDFSCRSISSSPEGLNCAVRPRTVLFSTRVGSTRLHRLMMGIGALLINMPGTNATKLVQFKDLTWTHNHVSVVLVGVGVGGEKTTLETGIVPTGHSSRALWVSGDWRGRERTTPNMGPRERAPPRSSRPSPPGRTFPDAPHHARSYHDTRKERWRRNFPCRRRPKDNPSQTAHLSRVYNSLKFFLKNLFHFLCAYVQWCANFHNINTGYQTAVSRSEWLARIPRNRQVSY